MDTAYTTKTGWLCLDFTNTVEWHASDHPEERLYSYGDFIDWAEKTGIVTADAAAKLKRTAAKKPAEATKALTTAITLREALFSILAAAAHGEAVTAGDLATVNRAAADLNTRSRLVAKDGGFTWELDAGDDDLQNPLWPVVRSALELLTSAESLERVGQCADADGCGWLFWDTSRNRSRRWCDMGDCGNRAKVRRYYSRKKKHA